MNWRGERSRGWGGWAEKGAEVNETFRFVCPNNPAARAKTLRPAWRAARPLSLHRRLPRQAALSLAGQRLRRGAQLLLRPLPPGGEGGRPRSRCRRATVRGSRHRHRDAARQRADGDRSGSSWLAGSGRRQSASRPLPPLPDGQHHPAGRRSRGAAAGLGRKVALDLFSPGLAQLVGQDYRASSRHCAWAKPMTYRVALGPAGLAPGNSGAGRRRRAQLRSRRSADRRLGGAPCGGIRRRDAAGRRASRRCRCRSSRRKSLRRSATMAPVPVYFGLELVRHPGVIDITPALVEAMVRAGRAANAAGLIISWDLMHAPMDGIEALAAALSGAGKGPSGRRCPRVHCDRRCVQTVGTALRALAAPSFSSPRRPASPRRSPW